MMTKKEDKFSDDLTKLCLKGIKDGIRPELIYADLGMVSHLLIDRYIKAVELKNG